jgi:hypothetical protein
MIDSQQITDNLLIDMDAAPRRYFGHPSGSTGSF